MREIQIPPKRAKTRYGCDFCKKTTARKATMEIHELMCYYNPDRICPNCDGSGKIIEDVIAGCVLDRECLPCKTAEEIQAYITILSVELNFS